jgi:hypothetical protein
VFSIRNTKHLFKIHVFVILVAQFPAILTKSNKNRKLAQLLSNSMISITSLYLTTMTEDKRSRPTNEDGLRPKTKTKTKTTRTTFSKGTFPSRKFVTSLHFSDFTSAGPIPGIVNR